MEEEQKRSTTPPPLNRTPPPGSRKIKDVKQNANSRGGKLSNISEEEISDEEGIVATNVTKRG